MKAQDLTAREFHKLLNSLGESRGNERQHLPDDEEGEERLKSE